MPHLSEFVPNTLCDLPGSASRSCFVSDPSRHATRCYPDSLRHRHWPVLLPPRAPRRVSAVTREPPPFPLPYHQGISLPMPCGVLPRVCHPGPSRSRRGAHRDQGRAGFQPRSTRRSPGRPSQGPGRRTARRRQGQRCHLPSHRRSARAPCSRHHPRLRPQPRTEDHPRERCYAGRDARPSHGVNASTHSVCSHKQALPLFPRPYPPNNAHAPCAMPSNNSTPHAPAPHARLAATRALRTTPPPSPPFSSSMARLACAIWRL